MSALWLRSLTVLCLAHVALSSLDEGGVVWRDLGGFVTIKCRASVRDQDFLNIKIGLLHMDDVFSIGKNKTPIISKEFRDRLQFDNGGFPDMDIKISNLTIEDTGPYWCIYTKAAKKLVQGNGNGSVLLVVKEKEQCAPQNAHLGLGPAMLGSLVGFTILLLVVIMGFLVFIIYKTKTRKATRMITNDVYQDMRGTLRR